MIHKRLYLFLLLSLPLFLASISLAGTAAPDENPYGTWHAEYNRNIDKILIMKSEEEDEIRDRLQHGDPLFGFLYSNNSSGYKGIRGGIYQNAESNVSNMNRTQKAFAAKNKAFVYLMGLDESLETFANPNDREVFKQEALSLLRTFDTSTGGFSDRNALQQRARELICYLQAYDMLKPIDVQGIWEENIARRLFQYARNICYGADAYSSFLSRNNHRIIIGSALGLAGILLGEWGNTESSTANSNERSYRPDIWVSYAMVEINSVMFQGTVHQVFPDGGYNEGPHYLRYSMAAALPFFKAMKNFGEIYNLGAPPGDWMEEYSIRPDEQDKYYLLRSPWFGRKNDAKPDIRSVLEWITKLRQPEGRLPALADTYFDAYFPETAIFGSYYFWPIESFIPGTSPSHHINLGLSDFMETRVDVIVAGNLPQASPSEWKNMQIFDQTGDIEFRSGWDLNDVYFHIYAKDYVYASNDYDRNSHLHDDNSSFLLGFNKQVLALDCGYISWDRRNEVAGPDNHNVILIDYINGPSKTSTKAQIIQTIDENFYKFAKINTDYWGTVIKRNVLFCNEKYFIINDQLSSSNNNVYTFLLHGNDPSPDQFPQGATWQVEDAKLKTLVTSQLSGASLSTDYYLHYHDNGYNRTSPHIVLKVSKSANDTQFLSVHFPYKASGIGEPEIVEVSAPAYAGLFTDRTSDPALGNRYEVILSQWPAGNDIHFPSGTYGSANKNINDIYTDADLLVMSFDANTPDDPNLIEVFDQNMTYLNYGGLPLYPNQPPQLNSIENQTVNEGEILEVPISASDPNGDYISFSVHNMPLFGRLVDNGDGSGKLIFTPDFSAEGFYYDIEVIAGDDETPQLTDIKTLHILQVGHVNQLPTAIPNADIKNGVPPLTINFNGSSSHDSESDPEGSIMNYLWEFGDGIISDLANIQHTYTIAGKFTVKLTVTDNEGAVDIDTLIIKNNANLNKIYISEISDGPRNSAFLEMYNDADYDINLTEFKLAEYGGIDGQDLENVFDFNLDEKLSGGSIILPHKGLLVVGQGINQAAFESDWYVLPANSNYNIGNSFLYFDLSKRWQLYYFDGTVDNNDGSLIDDTQQKVSGGQTRVIQTTRGEWKEYSSSTATPGYLEYNDQSLPVSLSVFQAIVEDNKIILRWQTQSELNNLGFMILKSQNPDSLFKTLASYISDEDLKGLGNSAEGKVYTYTDNKAMPGINYWYKLLDISTNGLKTMHGPVTAKIDWDDKRVIPIYSNQIPDSYALHNNYPNPFNSFSNIEFDVPASELNPSPVIITIYDILGRKIKELYNGSVPAGRYLLSWNGRNQWGEYAPTGIYLCIMQSREFNQSHKIIILR